MVTLVKDGTCEITGRALNARWQVKGETRTGAPAAPSKPGFEHRLEKRQAKRAKAPPPPASGKTGIVHAPPGELHVATAKDTVSWEGYLLRARDKLARKLAQLDALLAEDGE
jgi:hypothetical protein